MRLGRIVTIATTAALALSMAAPAFAAEPRPAPPRTVNTADQALGAPPAPAELSAGTSAAGPTGVCLRVHMQEHHWLNEQCAPAGQTVTVGEPGQGRAMDGLDLTVSGVNFCVQANVQGAGWQGWACPGAGNPALIGTFDEGLRMETVEYGVATGTICGNAYVQDIGWQGWYCGVDGETNAAGTVGQNRRIEAISFFVP